MVRLHKIALFVASVTFSHTSIATTFESISHLNDIARTFVASSLNLPNDESLELKISDAGSQIRVPVCDKAIDISLPTGTNQHQISTLEMNCTGSDTWHIFVPISMKIFTNVLVAKQMIPSSETISEDMLDYARMDKNTLFSGYYKDKSEVIGQTAMTALMTGTVLTKRNIHHPTIINREQSVSIVSRHGTIMVKANGIAKSSGALNDIIRVLNPSSKRIIDATVVNSSTVEIRA